MSLLSESGRATRQKFLDWVNADSFEIPQEIVFPPKPDDHGHGHDDHGDGHGHDDHGHGEHCHDEHGHDDHGHDAHGHEEHAQEEHAHEEHAHEEHAHEEHGHEEHGHEEHGHDEHGHDEHGHDEHGHDEHGHHEHLDPPCVPQPSREEVRKEQIAAANAKEEEALRERAEKVAAAVKVKEETPKAPGVIRGYTIAAIVCGVLVAAILLITVALLPQFGSETAPAVNEVSERYLAQGLTDTGAVNAVAAVILDYRAFDTLGESVVLFTATVTVIFLLKQFKRKGGGGVSLDDREHYEGMRSLPARVVFGITVPFILLYGIYIVVNGHLSPGGGFSGGTILGGALILTHLVFGERHTERFISVDLCTKVMAAGLFIYIALKTYHVLTGANGAESVIPLGSAGSIFSAGLIFPLNICVGLIVACTIYSLYHLFTSWKA